MPSRRSTFGGQTSLEVHSVHVQRLGRYNTKFWFKTHLVHGSLANILLFLDNVGTRAIRVAYYD